MFGLVQGTQRIREHWWHFLFIPVGVIGYFVVIGGF